MRRDQFIEVPVLLVARDAVLVIVPPSAFQLAVGVALEYTVYVVEAVRFWFSTGVLAWLSDHFGLGTVAEEDGSRVSVAAGNSGYVGRSRRWQDLLVTLRRRLVGAEVLALAAWPNDRAVGESYLLVLLLPPLVVVGGRVIDLQLGHAGDPRIDMQATLEVEGEQTLLVLDVDQALVGQGRSGQQPLFPVGAALQFLFPHVRVLHLSEFVHGVLRLRRPLGYLVEERLVALGVGGSLLVQLCHVEGSISGDLQFYVAVSAVAVPDARQDHQVFVGDRLVDHVLHFEDALTRSFVLRLGGNANELILVLLRVDLALLVQGRALSRQLRLIRQIR